MSWPSTSGLLGIRYQEGGVDPETGIDCLAATKLGLRHIFRGFNDWELPCGEKQIADALDDPRMGEGWKLLGDDPALATSVGDILFGWNEDDGKAWIGVLWDPIEKLVFTANRRKGGTCLMKTRLLAGCQGVYRRDD